MPSYCAAGALVKAVGIVGVATVYGGAAAGVGYLGLKGLGKAEDAAGLFEDQKHTSDK